MFHYIPICSELICSGLMPRQMSVAAKDMAELKEAILHAQPAEVQHVLQGAAFKLR